MKTIRYCDICEKSYGVSKILICPKCKQKTKTMLYDEIETYTLIEVEE